MAGQLFYGLAEELYLPGVSTEERELGVKGRVGPQREREERKDKNEDRILRTLISHWIPPQCLKLAQPGAFKIPQPAPPLLY